MSTPQQPLADKVIDMGDGRLVSFPGDMPDEHISSVLMNSQPTQFEKDRSENAPGRGLAAHVGDWIQRQIPTEMPSASDVGMSLARHMVDPAGIIGSTVDAAKGYMGARSRGQGVGYSAAAGLAAPLGVDAERMEKAADVGDAGGVIGEGAIPAAMGAAPLALKGGSALRERIGAATHDPLTGAPKTIRGALHEAIAPDPHALARSQVEAQSLNQRMDQAAMERQAKATEADRKGYGDALEMNKTYDRRMSDEAAKRTSQANAGIAKQREAQAKADAMARRPVPVSQSPGKYRGPESVPPPAGTTPPAADVRPMRPLIGSEADWNAYEQRMGILKPEAQDAGTYHAARGSAKSKLNLQQRMDKKMRSQ